MLFHINQENFRNLNYFVVVREISIVDSGSFQFPTREPPTDNRVRSKKFNLPQYTLPVTIGVVAESFHSQTKTPPLFRKWEYSPLERPKFSSALASLDDKIYLLSDNLLSIYQNIAPFTCKSKVSFPHATNSTKNLHTNPARHFMEACHIIKCIYIYVTSGKESSIWKLTTPDCALKLWMPDIGHINSLSVTSSGQVALLKAGQGMEVDLCYLEIYNKEAAKMHRLELPCLDTRYRRRNVLDRIAPFLVKPQRAVEISPGNLAIDYGHRLIIQSVNFNTSTIGPVLFQFPTETFLPCLAETLSADERIISYSDSRMILGLFDHLAIFDQRLNMDVIQYCFLNAAEKMSYNKDKRQLIVWSPSSIIVSTFTLAYKGEDIFAVDNLK